MLAAPVSRSGCGACTSISEDDCGAGGVMSLRTGVTYDCPFAEMTIMAVNNTDKM